jgi:hypothetical protein
LSAFRSFAVLGLCVPLVASSMPVPPETPPALLPEIDEMRLALEAAPAHLRDGAGVFVLEASGYREARASRNGFNCLIEREVAAAFEPRCFDAEGSATLLPVTLFRAARRARGVPRTALDREVAERYRRHEFLAPRRAGVCYMLSSQNVVVVDRVTQKVQRVGPRLLFYAPNVGSEDLGATPDLEARLLVTDELSAGAMIVVPVASARRTRVHYFSPENQGPLTRARDEKIAEAVPRHGLDD